MKIYCGYKSWTRDCRPRWVLDELGLPYEKVNLDVFKGEHKSADYMRLHPLGKIPFLQDGDVGVFESGAMITYLSEKHGEQKLIPAKGTKARAEFYQWIAFVTANVEGPIVKMFSNRYLFPSRDRAKEIAEEGEKEFTVIGPILERALDGKDFLVGNSFSGADIMLATALNWADKAKALEKYPTLKKYLARLSERPAYKKVFAPTEREFEGYPGK